MIIPNEHEFLARVTELREKKIYDYDGETTHGLTIGLTNGCFDLIHPGHVAFLHDAWEKCDLLIVLVNSNRSVRELKGPTRPVHDEAYRAAMVDALAVYVHMVHVFDDLRVTRWLELLRPAAWYKASDYTIDSLDQGEVAMARQLGIRIELIPIRVKTSTTKILQEAGIS